MSESTGNVFNDPRTIGTGQVKQANPGNVIEDELYGGRQRDKYGPAVGDRGDKHQHETAPAASPFKRDKTIKPQRKMPLKKAGEAVAGTDQFEGENVRPASESIEDLPEAARAFGPAVGGDAPKVEDDGSAALVVEMKALYQRYTRGKAKESQAAYKELQRLTDEEFAREGGARDAVAKYVKKQGFGRSKS